jgi:VCBS repeat-containing protein
VGIISFDGHGSLVQEGFVVRNGVEVPGATFNPSEFVTDQTGTYSVNPDCTGTAVIDLAPGNQRTLAFVISKAAHTIHAIVALALVGGNPALVQVYSDFEKIEGRE